MSNLLTFSEQFDNAVWTHNSSTTSADVTSAPNGTTTADKLIEVTATNTHNTVWNDFVPVPDHSTVTFSAHAKLAERSWAYIQLSDFDTIFYKAWFNLGAGTVGSVDSGMTSAISSAGGGFYRISASLADVGVNTGDGTLGLFVIGIATGDTAFIYAGTSGNGIYLWGAQFEIGTLGAYAPVPPYTVAGSFTLMGQAVY